ncbi:MAG: hypothetical protein PHW69_05100 [Elusimicrobiaceae bacterium]|nr:hypothetical protein [Elusimicrobiaceae bacterium]
MKSCIRVLASLFFLSVPAVPADAALDSGANAPDWKMTFGTFVIGHSNFDEASLAGRNKDKHVWGNINSVLLDAAIEKYAGRDIFVNLVYRRTLIKTSDMHSALNYPGAGPVTAENQMYGYSDFIDMNALWRFFKTDRLYMDLGIGYGYSWTDKNFTNRSSTNNSVAPAYSNAYAVYQLEFYGPKLDCRFRWLPSTVGFEAKAEGSTLMRNNIRYVIPAPQGYCTSASGSYYKADAKLLWVPRDNGMNRAWEFGLGYQKGGFFFDRMNDDAMDLSVKFEGVFFDVAYRFGSGVKS